MNASNLVRLFNRFITIGTKTFVVVLVLLTGVIIFSVRMAGLDIYRKAELRTVYKFDKLDFALDDVHFTISDGKLVTVARANADNELVIFGQGEISWYREPRLKTFTKLLVSLNAEDLQQVIAANRDNLEELLKYEGDAIFARREARSFISEEHVDRFRILGVPGFTFVFLRLPPPGEIEFDIYNEDDDLGDYMSNYERAHQPRSAWQVIMGFTLSILFLATGLSVILFIALISAVLLTYAVPAANFVLSLIRKPAYQDSGRVYPIINLGLSILLIASLILILQVF